MLQIMPQMLLVSTILHDLGRRQRDGSRSDHRVAMLLLRSPQIRALCRVWVCRVLPVRTYSHALQLLRIQTWHAVLSHAPPMFLPMLHLHLCIVMPASILVLLRMVQGQALLPLISMQSSDH